MDTTNNHSKEQKPLGFGKTMLASAVGFIIGIMALNIISFIFIIGMLASALSSSMDDSTPITGNQLAVELNVSGAVSEAEPNELMALFGNEATCSLTQMLSAIDNAATDKRVKALYLHFGASDLSWAQAEELKDALKAFRAQCDKPIIAYGESLTQPEYYLATAADKIAVHPSGLVEFKGLGAEYIFYKGLLDKLGVHMELIRPTSCAYKSAGEVYTRTDMSDANREQVRSYINSTWQYVSQKVWMARDHKAKLECQGSRIESADIFESPQRLWGANLGGRTWGLQS